jgi:hypothetical protein
VQESKTPASAGVLVLDGPSTRVQSFYAKAHTVQDTSVYNAYTAGQAVAQIEANPKEAQISQVCYSSSVVPEYNDRLAADAQLSATQDQKNKYQRGWTTCCQVCGKPPVGASRCACAGLTPIA